MPYINEERRQYWNRQLTQLEENVTDTDAGDVNYIITKILIAWVKNKLRYIKICMVIGTLFCVALEFYRRVAAPYEDKKIKENGDVYDDLLEKG